MYVRLKKKMHLKECFIEILSIDKKGSDGMKEASRNRYQICSYELVIKSWSEEALHPWYRNVFTTISDEWFILLLIE